MTTIANAVIGASERAVAAVLVARTVVVVSYDADQQTVRVREVVAEDPIEIDGVPVRWPIDAPPGEEPRGMTWGIRVGSRGTLLVRDVSHDEVDAGAAIPVTPASSRRWNLADGEFWPGFVVPGSLASGAYRVDGQMVIALPSGEALYLGASTATLRLVIEDVLRPYLVSLKAAYDAHTHTVAGVTAGPGSVTSAPPTAPSPSVPASADLASGRVLVDT